MTARTIGSWMACAILAFGATVFAGCIGTATGTLTVCIQDAPADEFSAIFLTFGRVEVQRPEIADVERTRQRLTTSPVNATENNTTTPTATTTTATTTGAGASANTTALPLGESCLEPGDPRPGANETGNATTPTETTTTTTATTPAAGTAQTPNLTEANDTRGRGWIAIEKEPQTVNLTEFSGGLRALLGTHEIPIGEYTHVRLHVEAAWGTLETNGSRVDFKVPSEVVRINEAFEVRQDRETRLIVDFDLERTLVQAGASGQWIFKPVITVIVEEATTTADGEGATTPPRATTPRGTDATVPATASPS